MRTEFKKRKLRAKDIPAIIAYSSLVLFALYIIFGNMYNRSLWNNPDLEKRYTVGTIYGYIPGAKGCRQFEYEFDTSKGTQKGQHCIVSELGKKRPNELVKMFGEKFLVMFIRDKPKYCEFLIEFPVKEDSIKIPKDGWTISEIDSVYNTIGKKIPPAWLKRRPSLVKD